MTPSESLLGVAWPADGPGWFALLGAAVALVVIPRSSRHFTNMPWRRWVGLWALLSVLTSAAYVHAYLHGGPRIIDATSYWLEARGMSSGLVSWWVDAPTASFRGRFLLHHLQGDGSLRMGVIFPPGYPLVLALGFLLGVPMLVGPLLAGALTASTAELARLLTRREEVGRVAAVLATLNACLRYHTADTMSHGLAALLLAGTVIVGLRAATLDVPAHASAARPKSTHRLAWMGCGLLAGWLGATRPATALALVVVGVPTLILWGVASRRSSALWCLAGVVVPASLLMIHQHQLTGTWFTSSQQAYYALSDGPLGCFRYGFGRGIGCVVEHGPYVASIAPDGYGWSAALTTTGRRLYLHLTDILNYAPFAILLVAGIVEGRRSRGTAIAVSVPLALVAAYAPFYFDGSYPGGGARMLADGLPFEQVLVALGLVGWGRRFRDRALGSRWALTGAVGLTTLGFAVHASHLHLALRNRDAGRPLFEPSVLRRALGPNPRGLLFVDTDHGFNLAHDPAARDASTSLVVARERYDDRDRLLWVHLGRPPAWRYVIHPWGASSEPPRIERWKGKEWDDTWTFETEAEWPAIDQRGGYAAPTYLAPDSCVSRGRVLALTRTDPKEACVKTELPIPSSGVYSFRAWLVADGTPTTHMWIDVGNKPIEVPIPSTASHEGWPGRQIASDGRSCLPTGEARVEAEATTRASWVVCTTAPWLGLDRVRMSKVD